MILVIKANNKRFGMNGVTTNTGASMSAEDYWGNGYLASDSSSSQWYPITSFAVDTFETGSHSFEAVLIGGSGSYPVYVRGVGWIIEIIECDNCFID